MTTPVPRNFNDVMRLPQPAPAQMPPAEGGATDAVQAWRDAVDGKAKPPAFADTAAAARTWMQQPFTAWAARTAQADMLESGRVTPAHADAAAALAAGSTRPAAVK